LLSARQVQPGQTGQIKIEVKTDGLPGALAKSIIVRTNDPRNPQIFLSVSALVVAEIELSEPALFFGAVPAGKEATRELVITIASERDIRLLGAVSDDSDIAVRLASVPESNGKKTRLIASLKPNARSGYHAGTVAIKTSGARNPELRVMVRGIVGTP